MAESRGAEVDLTLVTLTLDAAEGGLEQLAGVLARYVVLSRREPGCRNIDLCRSRTEPRRFVVIEKWESTDAQRAHFDAGPMVDMAKACAGLLAGPPTVDLLDGISAHDLA